MALNRKCEEKYVQNSLSEDDCINGLRPTQVYSVFLYIGSYIFSSLYSPNVSSICLYLDRSTRSVYASKMTPQQRAAEQQQRQTNEVTIRWFQINLNLLASYVKYPESGSQFVINLARSGFLYIGRGDNDKVMCVFCGAVKENWKRGESIEAVHADLSPDCPRLKMATNENDELTIVRTSNKRALVPLSESCLVPARQLSDRLNYGTNLPNSAVKQLEKFFSRMDNLRDYFRVINVPGDQSANSSELVTLDNHTGSAADASSDTSNLSEEGINHTKNSLVERQTNLPHTMLTTTTTTDGYDEVDSSSTIIDPFQALCDSGIGPSSEEYPNKHIGSQHHNPDSDGDPQNRSSLASRARNMSSRLVSMHTKAHFPLRAPKHTEKSLITARKISFRGRPESFQQSLAAAGFFFDENLDRSLCFFCGIFWMEWNAGGDPFVEHARMSPICKYIRNHRGWGFVDAVLKLNDGDGRRILYNEVLVHMTGRGPHLANESAPPVSVVQNEEGLPGSQLSLRQIGTEDPPSSQITSAGYREEDVQIHEELNGVAAAYGQLEEHPAQTLMPQQEKCKICDVSKRCVQFIECEHQIACGKCAKFFEACPICHCEIINIGIMF